MKKIISVTIAVACMALLFVGCSAENGKIGNGVNGTVTDNNSRVSSAADHNNASAGMNSSMASGDSLGSMIEGGVSAAGSAIEGGVSAAGSAIQSGIDDMTGSNNNDHNTANGASQNVSNNGV